MRATIDPQGWLLGDWHGAGRQRWRVTDAGIEVEGEQRLRRTAGEPLTARRVLATYGAEIQTVLETLNGKVTRRMLVATICIESGGNPKAERFESHLRDYSIGLTQTLTATARALAAQTGFPIGHEWGVPAKALPESPMPENGTIPYVALDEWRNFLYRPLNALFLGGVYHLLNDQHEGCKGDPVLLYAAYNAGSVRPADNPWRLAHYRKMLPNGTMFDAVDSFVAFYNDVCAVLSQG